MEVNVRVPWDSHFARKCNSKHLNIHLFSRWLLRSAKSWTYSTRVKTRLPKFIVPHHNSHIHNSNKRTFRTFKSWVTWIKVLPPFSRSPRRWTTHQLGRVNEPSNQCPSVRVKTGMWWMSIRSPLSTTSRDLEAAEWSKSERKYNQLIIYIIWCQLYWFSIRAPKWPNH